MPRETRYESDGRRTSGGHGGKEERCLEEEEELPALYVEHAHYQEGGGKFRCSNDIPGLARTRAGRLPVKTSWVAHSDSCVAVVSILMIKTNRASRPRNADNLANYPGLDRFGNHSPNYPKLEGRPSLDYLWYPPEERVVDEPTPVTSDASIVAQVRHEAAVERGEIIKIDDKDSESEDEEKSPEMTTAEVMKLCCTHKTACLSKGDLTQSMELSRALRQFRGNIQREETKNARQLTLSEAWGASLNK
ncbi:hypothetical protein B0H17DRAFT_1141401 [Mycena rosella]|uniref:Uncharacterized protein n=1 Tax=Mycena rosella TaxID=1033263 RepID=A0AAD7G932_MYCRO|nr:hypothetical protein B0H17DRAFT_1141401 [Mycena rosella]